MLFFHYSYLCVYIKCHRESGGNGNGNGNGGDALLQQALAERDVQIDTLQQKSTNVKKNKQANKQKR